MVTSYQVYIAYRMAKPSKKEPRIPTEENYRNRLSVKTLWNIDRCAGYFNTIYSNIDLDVYMKIGFDTYKTFSYKQILESKILDAYKLYDKRKKRLVKSSKDFIFDSFKHIDVPLLNYCRLMDQKQKLILSDYNKGYIDSVIVVYCMHHKLVTFNDIEEQYLYNIVNQYNEWVKLMFTFEEYIEELDTERKFI
jgi:hypothetical protein